MNATTEFYQTLSGMSFTLLGVWFAVTQFANGRWHRDPQRHRLNLHIALHFFLPGFLSLSALLSGDTDGGLLWRTVFALGGLVALVESLSFLLLPRGPFGLPGQFLRAADPILYTLMIVAAIIPPGVFLVTPLQIAGMVIALLFMSGLCYVWLAFAEPAPARPQPPR